jgi:Insecticide toxin TcdB middle/C-terminal region
MLLDDTVLPDGIPQADGTKQPYQLSQDEIREACRALKGSVLRQEIYALDGSDEQERPYSASERNYGIELLQSQGPNRHACFYIHPRETIDFHYERKLYKVDDWELADPRVSHALTLKVDLYGNVLQSVAIGYGRRRDDPDPALRKEDRDKQKQTLITYTENRFTSPVLGTEAYRAPLPCETRTYEVINVSPLRPDPPAEPLITYLIGFDDIADEVAAAADGHHDILYEDLQRTGVITNKPYRRLIECVRTLYRKDDLTGPLPLGELQSLALPGESYKLAFTPGLLTQVFKRGGQALLPDPDAVLQGPGADQGGYVKLDGNWWIPSGQIFYSPKTTEAPKAERSYARSHFFLPHRYCDPFGKTTFVSYDTDDANPQKNHNLLAVRTEDAVGNAVKARNDYRVLQPIEMTDPNGNRSELRFDALGMVVGTAVRGKAAPTVADEEGDSFDHFVTDLTAAQIEQYFEADDPHPLAPDHLGTATTRIIYDLDRVPACAATIARETHVSDLDGHESKLQLSFSYSDGFGREIQKKIQAEAGPVPQRHPDGTIIVGTDGQPKMTPDAVSPRWAGSGWTIFNNKGKPVRQFEPFFTDAHRHEFEVKIGVSPWLFYDPVERVLATLHPNHTWEKVAFDPWQQTTHDVNDMALTDPKTDRDVADYFRRLPGSEYMPSWHELRTVSDNAAALAARYPDEKDRANEKAAAEKAAVHAGTPTRTYFDTLGRTFMTLADNGSDPDRPDHHLLFATRVELDIEGNQRAVRDAVIQADDPLGRIVMRYAYDMLGNRIHQSSMEAGQRWMLNDVAGKPIRSWDSRGHNFATSYDALRRPVEQTVRGTTPDSDPRTLNHDILVDKIEYGEPPPNATRAEQEKAQHLNLLTRIYRHFDSAGIATNARLDANGNPIEAYDFKGNLLHSTRCLVTDYRAIPDWRSSPQLDAESFAGSTRYDALNRAIQLIAPHSDQPGTKINVIQPVFNEANLLERVNVWLEHAAEPSSLLDPNTDAPSPVGVADIDYDAKGQRTLIDYKTRDATVIRTTYAYDRETFRLTHLYTRRGVDPTTAQGVAFTNDCENPNPPPPATIAAPEKPPPGKGCGLQNLHYSYDPAGNITHIRDDAQQTIYFKNKRVEPSAEYTYDALYRLIEAKGREHLGLTAAGAPKAPTPHSYNDASRVRVPSTDGVGHFAPNDGKAMGTYTERYVYDAVGNFISMQHIGSDPANQGWTRRYDYNETSLIEPGKQGNRLTRTTIGARPPETYSTAGGSYDPHGNMLHVPQLQQMQWDYKDQLQVTRRQKVNDEDADGVEHHGERTWYVYDAAGQRVRKITERANNGGPKDERVYLGGFEIHRRHSGTNAGRPCCMDQPGGRSNHGPTQCHAMRT